jgi:hypothetical protein
MTVEHKIVVTLDDIRTISYECNKCRARVTFPLGSELDPAPYCYNCRNQWKAETPFGQESAFKKLLQSLNAIATLEKEKALGFRIRFEFDEATSASREAREEA